MDNIDHQRRSARRIAVSALSLGALAAGALHQAPAVNSAAGEPPAPEQLSHILAQFDNAFTPGMLTADDDLRGRISEGWAPAAIIEGSGPGGISETRAPGMIIEGSG